MKNSQWQQNFFFKLEASNNGTIKIWEHADNDM